MSTAVANRVPAKAPGSSGRKRKANQLMAAARREVEDKRSASELRADPIEVLQEVLDGRLADLRVAQKHVDELPVDQTFRDTIAGKVPNEWIRLRDHFAQLLEYQAEQMVKLGIADRMVQVQEAQAMLLAQAVRTAAEEAGLDPTQVKALGAALRRQMEGGA